MLRPDCLAWTDIVEVAISENHIVGLKSDGTVVAAELERMLYCEVSDFANIKTD
jgi:hypothetical protein